MFILNEIKKNIFFVTLVTTVLYFCTVLVSFALIQKPQSGPSQKNTLRGGWYTFDPYQYQKTENGITSLTGLDYELMKEISKEVGEKLSYEPIIWNDLLQEMKDGKKDFATGALYSEERAEYVYYSKPYREEEDAFFILKASADDLDIDSANDLLSLLKAKKLKLGVVSGFLYSDPEINNYVKDPENKDVIIKTRNDYENLELLLEKQIDVFIADKIVGSTIIWRRQAGKSITEFRLNRKRPIHLMFSKKTVSEETVAQYDKVIDKIKNSDNLKKINSWYLYPILFLQTEDADWFRFTDVLGTAAFAISGLIIAFKERTTLFGALILAILPSLGGGLMRDVVLGRNPVGALQSPIYLSTVLLTVLIGFVAIKLLTFFRKNHEVPGEIEDTIRKQASHILIVTDAIGLATFTVIGVIVSLLAKADPLWLWGPFFAFLTGAGGGILRDMLSKARYIAALEGEFYGEIAVFWGLLLSLFITNCTDELQPEYIQYAVLVTIIGAFLTRIVVYYFHLPNVRFGKEQ